MREQIRKRIQVVGDCWVWTGQMRDGYPAFGQTRIRQAMLNAKDRKVVSTCGSKKCVNPKHLYIAGEIRSIDELYSLAEPCPTTGCMLWLGNITSAGYGGIKCYGKNISTHRLAWILANGPIPDELQVQHLCNTRSCIAAHHLVIGTNEQNLKYMVECGRSSRGERHGRAKLTEVDIAEIRQLAGTMLQKHIAELYGVDQTAISAILTRKKWKHM